MNFVEFPIVIGTAARESQPRRFRCKHGHIVSQDTPLTVSVYGQPHTALICPVCVVDLLGEMCATEEIAAPAPPPTLVLPIMAGAPAGSPSNVVNPPIPFSEVLRRRREAQGIKPPEATPASATAAPAKDAASVGARSAPYTADWRCLSHNQTGDQPSEQFCPPERFVSVEDGGAFAAYVPPVVTSLGSVHDLLSKVEPG